MDNQGWIKDYRKEIDSDIWVMPPLYLKVWQYLKYKVNHKERYIPLKDGTKELIEKGEHLTSYEAIAKGVSYYKGKAHYVPSDKQIKSILDWLEKNDMITTKRRRGKNGFTKVKLVNYGVYQNEKTDEESFGNLLGNFKEPFENVSGNFKESSKTFIGGINKNDKECIKNDIRMRENEEEGKECKEEAPKLEPLFFPTPSCQKIYKLVGDMGYRTFFMKAEITEDDKNIYVKPENETFRSGLLTHSSNIGWQIKLEIGKVLLIT